MGLAFWGLTALARVQDNDPAAVRYVYPSAVFLLLLAVGLASPRAPRRSAALVVLALTALAIPSNIEGFEEGRDALVFTSNVASAEIGAMELARESVPAEYSPDLNEFPGLPSAYFFLATDRYGSSPADSPEEIAASPEYARRRADATSIAALGVRLRPARGSSPRGACGVTEGGRVELDRALPGAGIALGNRSDAPLRVELRRFARHYTRIGSLGPGETAILRVRADRAPQRRWHFRLRSPRGPVTVCRLPAAS